MRIKNFQRLVPVSFQFSGYSADEHEIALVDLQDRIVHVWNDGLQRYIPASDDLEAAVLAEFNTDTNTIPTQPLMDILAKSNQVWQETQAKYEAVKERANSDEL